MKRGSLTFVGTGIQYREQTTPAALKALCEADKVLYVVDNPRAEVWIQSLNSSAESLREGLRANSDFRVAMYDEMAERMLSFARQGLHVCVAFYGHPGVFVGPAHKALDLARKENIPARLLPGITAADCLFADLEIDPAQNGLQSYDATAFLIYGRTPDPTCNILLWQIGLVGDPYYQSFNRGGLSVLVEELIQHYEASHEVVVYQAGVNPGEEPDIQRIALDRLVDARVTPFSMLYIPPLKPPETQVAMLLRLMIERKQGA